MNDNWKLQGSLSLFVALLVCTFAATATAESPPVEGMVDANYVDRVNNSAKRVAIGYDQGMFGEGEYVQGLKLDVPLSKYFGVRVRPLWMHAGTGDSYDPSLIGRVGLYGTSPVFLGVIRMYGGGGPNLGWRPLYESSDSGDEFVFGGGGYFGWEFFMSPKFSFSLEVGGQSSVHGDGRGAGASVMAGFNQRF